MSRTPAAAGLAVCLWAWPGLAVEQVVMKLSLDDALELAAVHSPIVVRAQKERQVVTALRVGAALRLPANPSFSIGAGRRRDTSGSTPPSTGPEIFGHIEQTVEVADQRGARLVEVERSVKVARTRENFALVEARARARQAYLAALIAQKNVEAARRREALAEQLYESVRSRVAVGAASDVDLRLAEIERGRVVGVRIEAALGATQSLAELRLLLGLPAEQQLDLITTLARPGNLEQELNTLIALALARRADLEALAQSRSQLDAAIVRLHRETIPSPTFFIEVQRQQPGQLYFGAGVGLPLPLWRRNQGEIALVRAEQQRLDGERTLAEREVALEVTQAYRFALARQTETDLWEREVVPAAEAQLELVTAGWRAGKFDLFRVVQAGREAGEARHRWLELLGELWRASIDLDRAIGEPRPRAAVSLNGKAG